MRQCKYQTWNSATKTQEEKCGMWHRWSSDYEEFESGGCTFAVGVIENADGSVALPRADWVTFTDQPPTSGGAVDNMDSGFVEGFGYAIAWLKEWHGLGTEIEELYRHTGIPLADFEKYCDEYDLPSIREVAAAAIRGRPTAQPPTCQVQQNRRQGVRVS